ncbi:MAG: hypothetical protein HY079_13385, partial [Elusimicrobia bacterium]|nr:hypothetical protein [Elusimicrobiota bacterium]
MSCDPRNYRAPGILPAPTAGDSLPNDEFIRVVPLVPADETGDFPDCPPAFAYQLRMRPDGATAAAGCRFKTFRASVPLKDVPRRGPLGDLQGAALRGARIRLIRDLSRSLFRPLDPLWPGLSQALRAAPEQSVDLDPKLGLAGGLAALEALCAPSDGDLGGGPDAFVMGAKARRLLVSESEKAGLAPDYRFTRLTERLTLHYHGVPVLLGDVPDSDAWALRLSGPSGVRVLYADGQELDWGITTRRDASQGIVTASYALLVPEPRSVARVTGIFGERLDVGASVGRKDDCAEHDVLLESLASTPSVTGHLYPVLMSDGGSALADERDSPRSASDFDPEHPDARTVERIRQLEKEAQEKKKRRHLTREEIIEI